MSWDVGLSVVLCRRSEPCTVFWVWVKKGRVWSSAVLSAPELYASTQLLSVRPVCMPKSQDPWDEGTCKTECRFPSGLGSVPRREQPTATQTHTILAILTEGPSVEASEAAAEVTNAETKQKGVNAAEEMQQRYAAGPFALTGLALYGAGRPLPLAGVGKGGRRPRPRQAGDIYYCVDYCVYCTPGGIISMSQTNGAHHGILSKQGRGADSYERARRGLCICRILCKAGSKRDRGLIQRTSLSSAAARRAVSTSLKHETSVLPSRRPAMAWTWGKQGRPNSGRERTGGVLSLETGGFKCMQGIGSAHGPCFSRGPHLHARTHTD